MENAYNASLPGSKSARPNALSGERWKSLENKQKSQYGPPRPRRNRKHLTKNLENPCKNMTSAPSRFGAQPGGQAARGVGNQAPPRQTLENHWKSLCFYTVAAAAGGKSNPGRCGSQPPPDLETFNQNTFKNQWYLVHFLLGSKSQVAPLRA